MRDFNDGLSVYIKNLNITYKTALIHTNIQQVRLTTFYTKNKQYIFFYTL